MTGFTTTGLHGGIETIPTGMIITAVPGTTISTAIAAAAGITMEVSTPTIGEVQVEAQVRLLQEPRRANVPGGFHPAR